MNNTYSAPPTAASQDREKESAATGAEARSAPSAVPAGFAYDGEHPVLPLPFVAIMGENRLQGVALSVAEAYVKIEGALDPGWTNHRASVQLRFDFEGFGLIIPADIVVAGSRQTGEMTLQFANPLGPHLPQLRHILNSYLSGDLVTLGSFLSYTGPTKPKAARAAENTPMQRRVVSLLAAGASIALIITVGWLLLNRAITITEPRPVFIALEGSEMRATHAGQISYLNPAAKKGEVVFSVNANSGDVLNFQLPCDCTVVAPEGIFEGATVLPEDVVITLSDDSAKLSVNTLISVGGLTKAMAGASAYLDLSDGRTLAVGVETTIATSIAAERGELFVPVELRIADGDLTPADVGKAARLRIVAPFLGDLFVRTSEDAP